MDQGNSSASAMPFRKIKHGQLFQLELNGPVWIKCKGGFRPGRGGQLHACQPHVQVFPFKACAAGDAKEEK